MNDELLALYEKTNFNTPNKYHNSRVPLTSVAEKHESDTSKLYRDLYTWETKKLVYPNVNLSEEKKIEILSTSSSEPSCVSKTIMYKGSMHSYMTKDPFNILNEHILHTHDRISNISSNIPIQTSNGISHPSSHSHGIIHNLKSRYNNSLEEHRNAKFPSKAGLKDWIKLPRQRQVELDEYEEFLNLGLGGIFDLDLDKVLYKDRKWADPKNDPSDFFNYGHTIETWQLLCNRIKSSRIEMQHSLPVSRYYRGHGIRDSEIDNGRFRGTWNYQTWIPTVRERLYARPIDLSVQIIVLAKDCRSKIRKLCSVQECQSTTK